MKPEIKIKRVYGPPEAGDGARILVDRLWPRGLSKDKAALDLWLKDIAPSDKLRKWFGHAPAKWREFERRYFKELAAKADAISNLRNRVRREPVTLLFAAKDEERNNAIALRNFLAKGNGKN